MSGGGAVVEQMMERTSVRSCGWIQTRKGGRERR